MNKNLVIMIEKYGNKCTLENFKGRTPYLEPNSAENSKENTPKSKPTSSNKNTDFSSAIENSKVKLQKKNTHLGITFDNLDYEDQAPKLPPIYVTPDHESEVLYSDLL